jgi:(p)ppGpp synthase/HD superfamily hydrolase
MNTSKKKFIQQYPYIQESETLSHAFNIAYDVHRKHIRKDGTMYITHPIASNEILRNEVFVD